MTDSETCRWFGTDGPRGEANVTITAENAVRLGQAAGLYFRRGNHRHRVLIAKDPRLSSYMIEYALVAGFTSAGMDVQLTGPIPTPAVAMLTRAMRADLGVMVTASHNRYQDNGMKLFGPNGQKLSDHVQHEIEALMSSDMSIDLAHGSDIGRAERIDGAQERYIEYAKSTLPKSFEFTGLRVVIDGANGAGYHVAPQVLRELGAEVFAIGVTPDGTNINRDCGSTSPQALRRKVLDVRADIGIALDGDADRVVIVDETGRIVEGDQILALIATDWKKKERRLKTASIVGTEMSSLALEKYLAKLKIKLIRSEVGDRHVLEEMQAHGCNFGGEPSGHIIMSDHNTTGDGLVAALQVMAILNGRPASQVVHPFEPWPQVNKDVHYKTDRPLENEQVMQAIAEGQARLSAKGRLVVRASGTEPVIRVMGEGDKDNLALVQSVVDQVVRALEELR